MRAATALFSAAVLAFASPGALADPPTQIHLSYGAAPATEMVVMWRTAADTATHVVEYGTTTAMGTIASGASAAAPNGAVGSIHTVTLSGLSPGTLYYYVCGDATAGTSAQRTFRTAPTGPRATVIAAYGDQGTTADASSVETLIDGHSPDLFLVLGDLSYANGGAQTIWDTWFDLIQPVAERAPHMPALGNHELIGSDLNAYLGRFTLPANERWYSYTVGNIHLVALDSNSSILPGSAQYDWAVNDLASAAADPAILWKMAYFHHAPYTSGTNHTNDGIDFRNHLAPIFDSYHVDLVLCGHEHNYERSFPMNYDGAVADTGLSSYADPTGVLYVVSGTGGQSQYNDFSATPPSWSAVRRVMYGFTKISVSAAGSLTVEAIKIDGTVQDSFTITKSAGDTIAPTVAIPTPANGGTVARGAVAVRTAAIDNAGVVRVDISIDGTLLTSDTLAPFETTWDATAAASGPHTIAATAFDRAGNSATASATVTLVDTTPATYVARNSVWKFNDSGTDLGSTWIPPGYDDSSWSGGAGVLGYGESYVTTIVSYGPDPANKYMTTTFRRAFMVGDPARVISLRLNVMYDDGFVAHLNGTEILRANMPAGAVSFSSAAASTREALNSYATFDVSSARSALVSGVNVLAVEVHQASAGSSDLVFDAELVADEGAPSTGSGGGGGGGGCGLLGIEPILLLALLLRRRGK